MTTEGANFKVVIVGAGLAGLAAASKLFQNQIKDVTVLEALDRVGGRIHTVQEKGDGVLELGAQWVHGCDDNPVYKIAKAHSLLEEHGQTEENIRLDEYLHDQFLTSQGKEADKDIVRQMTSIFVDIYNKSLASCTTNRDNENYKSAESDLQTLITNSDNTDDSLRQINSQKNVPSGKTSKEDFFKAYMARIKVEQHKLTEIPQCHHLKKALIKWEKAYQYECDGAPMSEVGLDSMGKYSQAESEIDTEFKKGFVTFLEILLEDIPQDRIVLSKPVKKIKVDIHSQESFDLTNSQITHTSSNAIQTTGGLREQFANLDFKAGPQSKHSVTRIIRTLNATLTDDSEAERTKESRKRCHVICDDGNVFDADFVIVTSSLGFLKNNESTFFEPPLPEARRQALKNVGFGLMDKVFLIWEEQFWSKDITGFQLLWCEDAPVHVESARSKKRTKSGRSWYDNMRAFNNVKNLPALVCNVCGEQAQILETLEDNEVTDVLVELLEIFTRTHVPRPKKIIRTYWHSNPYFRGTYSYLSPGTLFSDHDMLGEPIPSAEDPVLLFAGEAFSPHHFSTAHGAVETGWEAAKLIVKTIKSKGF